MTSTDDPFDILVAGAGATGQLAAIAFGRAGRRVCLVGRKPPPLHGRTVALFEGSLRALDALGLRGLVEGRSAAIERFRIIDDTGSPFAPPPALFDPAEIGLAAFGRNIGNDALVAALDEVLEGVPAVTRVDAMVRSYAPSPGRIEAALDDGRVLTAGIVVGADGHKSPARDAAGIGVREWSYPQVALTALLRQRRPHHGFSTEFHTRGGPFTFVPLPPQEGAPHRSSLVWLMPPKEGERRRGLDREDLGREIADRAHHRFGEIAIEGEIAMFPMRTLRAARVSGPRTLLVGEAAHAFPPLAAQGLNLGIRDVADAAAALDGVPLGDAEAVSAGLQRYEAARRADIDLRTQAVDLLNRSLLIPLLPMDALRGAALGLASALPPLRQALLSEGIMPALGRARPAAKA